MKKLCKDLGITYNPDFTTIARNDRLILHDRGAVVQAIPQHSNTARRYMNRVIGKAGRK